MWDNELAAAAATEAVNDNPIPADIQRNISSLLQSAHGGITVMDFGHRYTEKYGMKLKWHDYGFRSFTDLLKAVPGVNVVRDSKSDTDRIFLREYEPATQLAGSRQTTKLSTVLKNKNESGVPLAALPRDQRYPTRSMNADSNFIDSEKDREIRMRQKPLHSRFRNDDKWELHVRNFPYETTEDDLLEVFKIFGCNKIRLKNPDEKPPFAFATFNDYEQAVEAFYSLDGSDFNGRRLYVAFSRSSIVLDDSFLQRQEARQFPVEVSSGRQFGRQFPVQASGSANRVANQFPVDINVSRRNGGNIDKQASTDSKTGVGQGAEENRKSAAKPTSVVTGQKPADNCASKLANQSPLHRNSAGQLSPQRTNNSTDHSVQGGSCSGVTVGSAGTGVGAGVNSSDGVSDNTCAAVQGDRFDDDVRRRNADRLERLGSKNQPSKMVARNVVQRRKETVDRPVNNSVADRKFEATDTELKTVIRRMPSPQEEETVPKGPVVDLENEMENGDASYAKHRTWFTEHGDSQITTLKHTRHTSSDSGRPLALVSPQKVAAFSGVESRHVRSSNMVEMSQETELKQLFTAESETETDLKLLQKVRRKEEGDTSQNDSWLELLRSHRHLLSDPVECDLKIQQNSNSADVKPPSEVDAASRQTTATQCCEHETDRMFVKHYETDLDSTDETPLKCAAGDLEIVRQLSPLSVQFDTDTQTVLDGQNLLELVSSSSSDSVKKNQSTAIIHENSSCSSDSEATLLLTSDNRCETAKLMENVAEESNAMNSSFKVTEVSETGMLPEAKEVCCGKETDNVVNSLMEEHHETVPPNISQHSEDQKRGKKLAVRSKPKLPSSLAKKLLNATQVYSRSGFTVWTNIYSRDSANLGEIRLEFPDSVADLSDKQRKEILIEFQNNCTARKHATKTIPASTVLSAEASITLRTFTSGNVLSSDNVVGCTPAPVLNSGISDSIQVVTQTASVPESKQKMVYPANVIRVDEVPIAARKNSGQTPANGTNLAAAQKHVPVSTTRSVPAKSVKSVPPQKAQDSSRSSGPQEMMTGSLVRMFRETCPRFLPFVADDLPETLDIMVTYISDKQHFWAQVVNVGEYLESVQQMLDLMEQIMTNRRLPVFCSRDERHAVALYDGELTRVWIKSLGELTSNVFYIDYGNSQLVKTFNLFVPPDACWDVRPAATPFRYIGKHKNLESLVNTRCTARRVVCDSPSDQHIIVVDSIDPIDINR